MILFIQGIAGNIGPWGEVGLQGPPGDKGPPGLVGPRGVVGYPVSYLDDLIDCCILNDCGVIDIFFHFDIFTL